MKFLLALIPVFLLLGCASAPDDSFERNSDGSGELEGSEAGLGFGSAFQREGSPQSRHQQYMGGSLDY